MAKFGLIASIATIIGALTFANLSSTDAAAPCLTKDFKTQLVKEACAKGGQKAAKDAMKQWSKEQKIKSCNACHSKLAPTYALKKDGLDQYKKRGGK